MNPFLITGAELQVVSIPLKAPFITALGRKELAENACLRLRLAGGAEGWGEASSSVVLARLSPRRVARRLASLGRRAVGRDVRRWRRLSQEAWERFGHEPPIAAAFECALLEAWMRAFSLSAAQWFGGALASIETDLTISAWSPEESGRRALEALRAGFRTLKVKVTGKADDFPRIRAAAESGASSLILDGNQAFSLSSSLRLLERCLKARLPVRLFEQPLPREDLSGMTELCKASPVPIAADESARTPQEALRVLEAGAADALNVKIAKTGVEGSLEIIALARAAKKRLMIGCMQESARGLSMSVHMACGTGAFDWVDLDSDCLLGCGQPQGDYRRAGARVTWTSPSDRKLPRPSRPRAA